MADDELFYTNFGIDQAGDIVGRLMSACVCGPLDPDDACLPCCARTEIERLRAALGALAEQDDALEELIYPNNEWLTVYTAAVAIGKEARRG